MLEAAAVPTLWGAEALWECLVPLLPGLTVEVLPQCGSTNSQLLASARQLGADMAPCLLVAEHQTQGRGRLGRAWISAPGASLTFSLALPLTPADWSGLSLAVGLALAETLDPLDEAEPAHPRLMLKWPNDLWLRDAPDPGPIAHALRDSAAPSLGRKLGGILIETVSLGALRWCVVGVGLNVLPRPQAGPALRSGYASLQELDARATAPAVLARVAGPLVRELLRFEREGFAPLQARYAARDLLRGQEVFTEGHDGAAAQTGVAQKVDATGALHLRSAGGLLRVVSGEVSLRWDAKAPAQQATEQAA